MREFSNSNKSISFSFQNSHSFLWRMIPQSLRLVVKYMCHRPYQFLYCVSGKNIWTAYGEALIHFRNVIDEHATNMLEQNAISKQLRLEPGCQSLYEPTLRLTPDAEIEGIDWNKNSWTKIQRVVSTQPGDPGHKGCLIL